LYLHFYAWMNISYSFNSSLFLIWNIFIIKKFYKIIGNYSNIIITNHFILSQANYLTILYCRPLAISNHFKPHSISIVESCKKANLDRNKSIINIALFNFARSKLNHQTVPGFICIVYDEDINTYGKPIRYLLIPILQILQNRSFCDTTVCW